MAIARRHVAARILEQRCGVGGLRPERAAAGIAPQEPAVDLLERRGSAADVARRHEAFCLNGQQPRAKNGQAPAGPVAAATDRGGHAACAGHPIGGEGPLKRLFKRSRVGEIGGGVGRLLEEFGGPLRLVGVERDPAEHDQPPRGERVVELVADQQAAGQQRAREILLSLRPIGGANRHVDPRLRPVVGRGGPPDEQLGRRLERRTLPRQLT